MHQVTGTLPKRDRHTVGARICTLLLEVLELLHLAQHKRRASKLLILERVDSKLQLLKLLVRLLKDTRAIDLKKYVRLEEQLQQIGKELGGWLKSCRTK